MLETTSQHNNPLPSTDSLNSLGASGVDNSMSKLTISEQSVASTSSDIPKSCDQQLSVKMPDIALTASDPFRTVDDINVMDLDLGDGSASSISRRSHRSSAVPPISSAAVYGTQPRHSSIGNASNYHRQLSHSSRIINE